MKSFFKSVLFAVEATLFCLIYSFFYIIPFNWASNFGGWLFRTLCMRLPVNQTAYKNLAYIYPNQSLQFYNRIISGMWDNLGRTFCEYAQLPRQGIINNPTVFKIEGAENVQSLINDGQPGFILTTHQGNWELGTLAATKMGLKGAQVTRFLNNPYMRGIINFIHGRVAQEIIPKSTQGARRIIELMKQGHHISMMMDQKLNEGWDIDM